MQAAKMSVWEEMNTSADVVNSCSQLLMKFFVCLDRSEVEKVARIFTREARWTLPDGAVLAGTFAIRGHLEELARETEERGAMRHLVTTTAIFSRDARHARAVSYVERRGPTSRVADDGGSLCEYEAVFEKSGSGWLISTIGPSTETR